MKYCVLAATWAAFFTLGCNQTKAPEPERMTLAQPRPLESVQPYTPRYRSGDDDVTPVPGGPKPQPVLPQYVNYTVQKGDTFWSIAQRTLGQGKRASEIMEANPGLSPSALKVGQVIKIPSR
ncbi:MAG: LysM peptidoglycan-binding domain-containing protein [Planctomycetaceae bacterium]|nr:LysM peptidoglycan-binding domain-containing protein [Planctomycetaceae bacterium]